MILLEQYWEEKLFFKNWKYSVLFQSLVYRWGNWGTEKEESNLRHILWIFPSILCILVYRLLEDWYWISFNVVFPAINIDPGYNRQLLNICCICNFVYIFSVHLESTKVFLVPWEILILWSLYSFLEYKSWSWQCNIILFSM